jgi:hypothetical protein
MNILTTRGLQVGFGYTLGFKITLALLLVGIRNKFPLLHCSIIARLIQDEIVLKALSQELGRNGYYRVDLRVFRSLKHQLQRCQAKTFGLGRPSQAYLNVIELNEFPAMASLKFLKASGRWYIAHNTPDHFALCSPETCSQVVQEAMIFAGLHLGLGDADKPMLRAHHAKHNKEVGRARSTARCSVSVLARIPGPRRFLRPKPGSSLTFEDVEQATVELDSQGHQMLVKNRKEPWGQTVSRFITPEGLLLGITFTPSMRNQE